VLSRAQLRTKCQQHTA